MKPKPSHRKGIKSILLENIIANSPQFIFWKDIDSAYIGCNENFALIAGLKRPKDIVGKTDYDLPWANVADIYLVEDKTIIQTGQPIEQKEVPLIVANEKEIIILVSKCPLFDSEGYIIGILGIYMDITERKKNEALLKEAKIRAESADKAKTKFLMYMSHDIRTPVTGVISLSEILMQQGSSEQERHYSHLIHTSSKQLVQLLDDILDVISTESLHEENIKLESFDLRKSIRHLEELLVPNLYLKGIDFKISIDETLNQKIVSDRVKIERILLNLLGNAIKFTSHGYVEIKVKVLAIENEHAHLEFTISDTGIGVLEDQIDKVFDCFFRAMPSYEGVSKGHGIGLFVVKKFVTLLKGEINIQSKLGKGTTICVILPVKLKPITDKEPPSSKEIDTNSKFHKLQEKNLFLTPKLAPSIPQRPRVLLIDDNNIAQLTAKNFFHGAECEIEIAVDAESAIKMAKSASFDLIVTDIGLPGMSGNEFVVLLRYWEKTMGKPPVPIIGLSAHISDKIKKDSLLAGINDVLAKPLSKKKIKAILDRFMIKSYSTSKIEKF